MTPQEYPKLNGQDRSPPIFPVHREIIGKVRVGWTVFAILMSGFCTLAAMLIANGWIASPAKSVDLEAFKHDTAIELGHIRHDHAEFKTILAEMQRSQNETINRLTGIAATLTERKAAENRR